MVQEPAVTVVIVDIVETKEPAVTVVIVDIVVPVV